MPKLIAEPDLLSLLAAQIAKAGSLRTWARTHGLSAAYVSDVTRGRRSVGPRILKPLGYAREHLPQPVAMYRKVTKRLAGETV